MKIKNSMRFYIVSLSIFFGLVICLITAIFSTYNLNLGVDMATKAILQMKVRSEPSQSGSLLEQPLFIVASNWNDLPDNFKERFDYKGIEVGELYKENFIELEENRSKVPYVYFLLKDNDKYIAVRIKKSRCDKWANSLHVNHFPELSVIVTFVCLILAVLLLGILFIIHTVAEPIEKLKYWAINVQEVSSLNSIPDFKFSELNMMARIIATSLNSVRRTVEKEKEFIKYASHELRTPITIIRSNAELMRKMIHNGYPSERLINNINRIENNSYGMSYLCDSLLWLNHDGCSELHEKMTSLGALTEEVVNEQRYLLEGKSVDVEIKSDDFEYYQIEGMCRVVITNLIRNAFQHTTIGKIVIHQKQFDVTVINRNIDDGLSHESTGFGLGIAIIKKICKKYYWEYKEHILSDGRVVKIKFI